MYVLPLALWPPLAACLPARLSLCPAPLGGRLWLLSSSLVVWLARPPLPVLLLLPYYSLVWPRAGLGPSRAYVHHTLLSSHPLLLLYYWAEALGQGVGGGGGFGGLCCILRQLQP